MLPENCFFFSRNDANHLTQSRLFGYGITGDSIIFGTSGLTEYLASGAKEYPTEGRFCGIFIEGDSIVIRADKTGQESLYVYEDGDDWAVSNSFLLLASQVSKTKRLTFYQPAADGFHLKNGVHIGEQLISHQTMVKQIRLVPITSTLRANLDQLRLHEDRTAYLDLFSLSSSERYDEHLLDVLERGAGMMCAFGEAGYPLNMFLSGGYDSRLVLGMALASDAARENLRVTSHEFKQDDFAVAKSLTTQFSLTLNAPSKRTQPLLSASDAIRMYLLSCGGTYLPFYPVHSYKLESSSDIRVTGDQPTGWSHFAGKALFNGDAVKISGDIEKFLSGRNTAQQVKEDFLSTFDILGIESDHPAAMLAHYSAIRSRHHCGRNWYKSLGGTFLFTPLMQSSFVKLELYNNSKGRPSKQFFADCFTAIGNWAVEEAFETEDRAFTAEQLQASPFSNGTSITPRKYRVFGRIGKDRSTANPDIFSFDLNFDASNDAIKHQLLTAYYRSARSKVSGVFTDDDYKLASQEINANGGLAHGYRKVCHVVATDIVLGMTS